MNKDDSKIKALEINTHGDILSGLDLSRHFTCNGHSTFSKITLRKFGYTLF